MKFLGECNYKNLQIKSQLGAQFYMTVTMNEWENQITNDSKINYYNQIDYISEKIIEMLVEDIFNQAFVNW